MEKDPDSCQIVGKTGNLGAAQAKLQSDGLTWQVRCIAGIPTPEFFHLFDKSIGDNCYTKLKEYRKSEKLYSLKIFQQGALQIGGDRKESSFLTGQKS